jgi:hypothetical protein
MIESFTPERLAAYSMTEILRRFTSIAVCAAAADGCPEIFARASCFCLRGGRVSSCV